MNKKDTVNTHAIILLILLIIQYLLGMTTNLFINFPNTADAGHLWEFAWSQLPLATHIIIGVLLLFGSLALVIRSLLRKERHMIVSSAIGFIAMLIAGGSGATFITSQSDLYSFIMAVCFIIAFLAYCWGLYTSQNSKNKKNHNNL